MHVKNISDSNSTSNLITLVAHVVLTLCYLHWCFFLPPLLHLLYCHMWWSHCYLHCVVVVVVVCGINLNIWRVLAIGIGGLVLETCSVRAFSSMN